MGINVNNNWLEKVFSTPDLLKMGHMQHAGDENLGMGWLYYAIARMYRPRRTVCIGSWRGFVPMMFAKAMTDNGHDGELWFIDPSMVDDFWVDNTKTGQWFASFDLKNITHFRMTTQEFVKSDAYRDLENVDILFVDGYHTEDQARLDHEVFLEKMNENSIALFHDSVTERFSGIYGDGNRYQYTVCRYMDQLKNDARFQVFDFPFTDGLTLVRRNTGREIFNPLEFSKQ